MELKDSEKELFLILDKIYWDDSFIRECYYVSPSYIEQRSDGIYEISPDAKGLLKLLISTPHFEYPCIEFTFKEVSQVIYCLDLDLDIKCEIATKWYNDDKTVKFYVHGKSSNPIIAKDIEFKVLNENCLGWKLQYGQENYFDQSGFYIKD